MKQRKQKSSILHIGRLLIQVLFFVFLPALFIQSLNGVKQIYLAILNGEFSVELLPQVVELIAIIPITILLGRFFCGWMCAFGSFTDAIYQIGSKIFKFKWKVPKKVDAVLKNMKYLVLVVLIIVVWSLELSVFNTFSPWDVFGMTAIVGKTPAFAYVVSNMGIGLLIFILIIIASAFVERFFCRYLCPMGAVFAIFSKFRMGNISKPRNDCGKCRICTKNCVMGIALDETDVVKSAECINCMKCISVCPRHNVTFTLAKNGAKPLFISLVAIAVMLGSYYGAGYVVDQTNQTEKNTSLELSDMVVDETTVDDQTNQEEDELVTEDETNQTDQTDQTDKTDQTDQTSQTDQIDQTDQTSQADNSDQIYKDGTYEGSGTGFRGGTTTVSVTIEKDEITSISTVSTRDDIPYYSPAFTSIEGDIISSQSTEVDAVSGATFSSEGIIEAVSDALEQAKN